MQIQHLVSRWGTDINTLGSYSYDAVGKPHDVYERLRREVDNIFFAGEATSTSYPGSVHGAFSTGMMAAHDCKSHLMERHAGELDSLHPLMPPEPSLLPALPIQISRF